MPVSQMAAAMASSSIRPYMWTVTGPRSIVPVCGEGMDAGVTGRTFCPRVKRPALDQDLDRELVGAAALDQLDGQVQVDVVPGRQRDGIARRVAGSDQLLGAPVLDALELGVDEDGEIRSGHSYFRIREIRRSGSPPAG